MIVRQERDGVIEREHIANSIEEFAQMIVNEELNYVRDYALETTEIDIQQRLIKHEARYFLGGRPEYNY